MNEIYLGEAFLGKKTFNLLSIFEARKHGIELVALVPEARA